MSSFTSSPRAAASHHPRRSHRSGSGSLTRRLGSSSHPTTSRRQTSATIEDQTPLRFYDFAKTHARCRPSIWNDPARRRRYFSTLPSELTSSSSTADDADGTNARLDGFLCRLRRDPVHKRSESDLSFANCNNCGIAGIRRLSHRSFSRRQRVGFARGLTVCIVYACHA